MRPIFLIAWREYKQYVLSRGFLLFLILFPLALVFGGAAVGLVESSSPTRSFAVYDETGVYVDIIDRELEERRRREIVTTFDAWLALAINRDVMKPSDVEWPFGEAQITHRRLEAFFAAGGASEGVRVVKPLLRRGAPPFVAPKQRFMRVALPREIAAAPDAKAAIEAFRPYLLGERGYPGAPSGQLFAAVIVPQGFAPGEDGPPAEFWSKNLTDPGLEFAVSRALTAGLQRRIAADFGLGQKDLESIADVEARLEAFNPERLEDAALLDQTDRLQKAVLPAVMTYMLLVIIFGVGNLLLTNTIEERSNKIVEVLLSSVTADQLMIGKLIGIAAVGLTMPTVFLIGGVATALTGLGSDELVQNTMTALFASNLIPIYLFYFVCAYVIFAMIFLAIGAMSNSLQDAQSYMGPVMILVFLPMPFVIMAFQNPNGLVASILTWIPIYTPYAVMMRASANPPVWEIVGATAFMLAFAIVLARVMGRIFRQAILQSAPAKASDIWRLAKSGRA